MEGQKYLAPLQTTSGTAWQPPAGGVPPVVTPLESLLADDNSATDDKSANGRASPSGSLPGSVVSTQVNGNSLKERRPDLVKAGLLGSDSKVVWVGNIPESSAQDTNIRLLFADFGDIRRVYMRRKTSPSKSWCLLMFRASESAEAALKSDPPTVVDTDGTKVQLAVEHPNIEEQLTKANPGALGQVVGQALDDTLDGADDVNTSPKFRRRRSAAEIEVRKSVTSDQTTERVSVLGSAQATKRGAWNRVRKASVKKKLAVAAMFVQNDDANERAAKLAIAAKMKIVTAAEPDTTNTVRALAELYHGELRGLDYRFKTEASLFRKVMSRLDATLAEVALSKDQSPPPTPADILDSILDVLRYTAVFQTKDYTTSVRKCLAALADQGYKELRVKNFWGPGDGYQGINTVFVTPDDQPFELQFHTPESLSMKEEECHSSYEKFRTATDSRKMMQYWEEMVSMWDMVPVPEDVLSIPKEFDLSKLSAEEKAAIEHRKALEKVCRYPVDELHSRALRAEGEIGALVVYLMHKHGAHGVCEQKDRRSAVRGQLSILRQLVDTFIQEEAMHEQQLHEQMLTYLRGVSAFENVNETTLNAIAASLDVKAFKQGETILKKGDPGSTFFLIKEGTVGFSLNDDGKIQKTRTNPEFFGEISLLSDDNRITATAIARTNCECYTLQRDVFDELVRSNLTADSNDGKHSSLQHSKSKRALIDDSIATKLTVSTKMKPSKLNRSHTLSANSFREESGSVKSALHGGVSMRSACADLEEKLPDEPTLRDRLRELELEFPPLKYKIVVTNEQLYTMCAHGFLRDIAQDADYEIYAVNNWWDDLEKFGAVNARFLAVRHGLRFEITLHTTASWDAFTTHSEYMRRRFDTVIKTDVLYGADEDKIQKAKSDMRREEMWRDRWARIQVPDRALTVGTLRYAHVQSPGRAELEEDALKTVGQSRTALKKFKQSGRKVKLVNLLNAGLSSKRAAPTSAQPSGTSSATVTTNATMAISNDDDDDDDDHAREELAGVGGVWNEVVGAWLASDETAQRRFDGFRKRYVEERGLDARMWQPITSRVAGLELQLKKLQKRGGTMGCCCGRHRDPDRRSRPAQRNSADDQTREVRFSVETDLSQLARNAKVLEP